MSQLKECGGVRNGAIKNIAERRASVGQIFCGIHVEKVIGDEDVFEELLGVGVILFCFIFICFIQINLSANTIKSQDDIISQPLKI